MHRSSLRSQYVVDDTCENGNAEMSDSEVKAVVNKTSLHANSAARSTWYPQGTATDSSGTRSQSTGAQGGQGAVDEVTTRGESVRDGSGSANIATTTSATQSTSCDSAAESGEVGEDSEEGLDFSVEDSEKQESTLQRKELQRKLAPVMEDEAMSGSGNLTARDAADEQERTARLRRLSSSLVKEKEASTKFRKARRSSTRRALEKVKTVSNVGRT